MVSISQCKQMNMDKTMRIHSFDIVNGDTFVLYLGDNVIQIYSIINYIHLKYTRTLPLYADYQDFKFSPLFYNGNDANGVLLDKTVLRSHSDEFLNIVLYS
jgi:hypothetical protein